MSWPVASTAGEAAPSAGAVPMEVSPEDFRTNLRGMEREPGLDADADVGARAKPAFGLGVSSADMGAAVGSDAPGLCVAGDEGSMCSSSNANA